MILNHDFKSNDFKSFPTLAVNDTSTLQTDGQTTCLGNTALRYRLHVVKKLQIVHFAILFTARKHVRESETTKEHYYVGLHVFWCTMIVRDTGLTAADAWALADDRSTWRALRPTAGYAQQ